MAPNMPAGHSETTQQTTADLLRDNQPGINQQSGSRWHLHHSALRSSRGRSYSRQWQHRICRRCCSCSGGDSRARTSPGGSLEPDRTGIRASLFNYYKQNKNYRPARALMPLMWRLTVSAVLSPASGAAQTPPADRVVLGSFSTRCRPSAVWAEPPRRTG